MLGILLIDKPEGCTSHDVVDRVRRALGTRRVGHAGTLDPLATGLLVVAVGAATRFLQYLPLEPKAYTGVLRLGQTSSTYDREGALSEPAEIPNDAAERLERARPAFLGLIEQLPPLYSAVKVAGKPLYKYARQGQEAPREPRNVYIQSLDFSPGEHDEVAIEVVCSGGTYIRTLADDLGRVVGCGAYLSSLRRTRAGRFDVRDAVDLADVASKHLIPLAQALPPMPLVRLLQPAVEAVRHGKRVAFPNLPEGPHVALLGPDGEVIGVAKNISGELQPECVIPAEAVHG